MLAGARPDVLAAAPGARAKFVALGGVLLSTGGLAAVSAAFAVHMALGVWWPFALLVGLGWGAVIVNLDRMLLVGMAHDSSLKRNLVLAVPRVGLALVLGVVVATPLTLQVFHKEIDTEIVTMQAEAADAYRASLDRRRAVRAPAGAAGADRHRARRSSPAAGWPDAGLAVVRGEVTAKQAELDAGGRDRPRARGEGAVRARRHLRHRRRRDGDGLRGRPGRRPTRRRRSWPSARSDLGRRRRGCVGRRGAQRPAGRLVAGRPTGPS